MWAELCIPSSPLKCEMQTAVALSRPIPGLAFGRKDSAINGVGCNHSFLHVERADSWLGGSGKAAEEMWEFYFFFTSCDSKSSSFNRPRIKSFCCTLHLFSDDS